MSTTEIAVGADELRPRLPDDTTLPYGRGRLSRLMPPSRVAAVLGSWQPFPEVSDREPWEQLPAACRERTRAAAETALDEPWPELPASVFADYERNGDRSRFELSHFARRRLLRDLVLGAGMVGGDRYTDAVLDAVWSICEESFWGVPAHSWSTRHERLPLPDPHEPVIDLFAAETGAQLAWTRYLMGEQLVAAGGQAFDERVVTEIDRRLLIPFRQRDDWHWLARENRNPNNWTPWICSNLLVVSLLTEADPRRRAAQVSKVVAALDAYVEQLLPDGGCSEGQSYWAVGPAKLLDCLEALHGASGGELDGLGLPEVAALSRYPVAMHVTGREMIQHADGHGQWLVEASVLHRAGRLLDDPQARQLAVHLRDISVPRVERAQTNLWRGLSELFEPGYVDAAPTAAPFPQQRWFGDLQVLTARQHAGTSDGLLVCFKAGHNGEHHNQNDVGGLSVALDGQHVVVDPGVSRYTRQTFGPRRYELWEMNSDWHALPVANHTVQRSGPEFAARSVGFADEHGRVTVTADLAPAWPSAAGLGSYVRTVSLDRTAGSLVVTDAWQGLGLTSLMVPLTLAVPPGPVEALGAGHHRLRLPTATGALELEVEGAEVETEEHQLTDPDLSARWGGRLWRLLLTPTGALASGQLQLTFRRHPDSG